MFEENTQELILRRMLERVPAKFDKREGSIIFDATAPASVELQNFYINLDIVLSETFADTASREYLIKRCAERGITPKPASYAVVLGQFTPSTLEIPIGTRFSHEDFNYAVTEKVQDGLYYLQCESLGREPNGVTGQLIPIDFVNGLQTAEIVEVTILGEDEEETESLRARYFASLKSDAFGGNKIDYKNKVLSISGVGAVKVYSGSEWNGGGTVKVVVLDSDFGVPTETLIEQIQTTLDPESNMGEGVGIAPIGHFVTVVAAYNTTIDIVTTLTFDAGYSYAALKSKIESEIDSYFASLNESWQNLNRITVRIAQLESRILNIDGIIDITGTTINGKAENLMVDKDSIVTRGTINGN